VEKPLCIIDAISGHSRHDGGAVASTWRLRLKQAPGGVLYGHLSIIYMFIAHRQGSYERINVLVETGRRPTMAFQMRRASS
jgi:hypothetical protein